MKGESTSKTKKRKNFNCESTPEKKKIEERHKERKVNKRTKTQLAVLKKGG